MVYWMNCRECGEYQERRELKLRSLAGYLQLQDRPQPADPSSRLADCEMRTYYN